MSETFTLTRGSLVKLLDMLALPNPDDPDSPIGPALRPAFGDLSWALLNPQPLPPRVGPQPDSWRRLLWVLLNPQPLPPKAGPRPEPWRSAFMARMVIDQAVGKYRSAEMSSTGEGSEWAFEAVRSTIREFVDDYCGTVPRRWPLPWPWPLTPDSTPRDPLDLLVAGAQFQKASDAVAGTSLQEDFMAAADQLFETGLSQLQSE